MMSRQLSPFTALLCSLLFTLSLSAQIELRDLRTEYQPEPLALETDAPRFSWRIVAGGDDNQRGIRQAAYRIRVTDETDREVWNSGWVADSASLHIAYAGEPLQPTARYDWSLRVWTTDGATDSTASFFETALTLGGDSQEAWHGAQWIGGGGEDLVLYSPYLSVFRLGYRLQLDEASATPRAALLFGGNDPRFRDPNKNLFGRQNQADSSYVAVELDVSALDSAEGGPARLHLYRVGYTGEDRADRPLYSFDIPAELIDRGNRYGAHAVYLELVFGTGNVYLDGQDAAHRLNDEPFNLNPYGSGGDFISAPMLAEVGYRVPAGGGASFTGVGIRNYRSPANVLAALPDTTFAVDDRARHYLTDPSRNAAPLLRTEFTTDDRSIRKARLYVTARGIYELYLNGERVGEDYFNPGLTQYNRTHFYQTYDVTDRLRRGQPNALGAWLSEGWWSGNLTFRGEHWNYFGDRQSLLAQLIITYADGSERVVTTNDRDWKLYTEGPIRYGSFFQGEVYDARREPAVAGWAQPDYDDGDWKPARVVPLEGTSMQDRYTNFAGEQIDLSYDDWTLRSQPGENVTVVDTLRAASVEEVRPGVFVYDMGQNMVGVPRIDLPPTEAGDTLTLRYAEVRYPDLPESADNTDMVMLENIRAALAQDLYICQGRDRETIQPRFTFHGYRFLELTGVTTPPPPGDVRGLVLSSVRELAADYETSNPLVNRLWENITWSLRGNFLSIPTDTPARNERMGWNGDINVFSRAATWLADVNRFLTRHALAMRDVQSTEGRFTDVAPVSNGFGGTIWGSAGLVVPWENYRQYGDRRALADHYPAMQRYVDFLDTRFEDGLLMEGPLGDWLSPENGKNDNSLLWAAYYAHNLDVLARAAAVLVKPEDARRYRQRFEDFRRDFNERYVDPTTGQTLQQGVSFSFRTGQTVDTTLRGKLVDTQASYAVPLAFGLFAEEVEPLAEARLAASVERANVDDSGVTRPPYSLMTGFIGTAAISVALSGAGRDDLAYRLLQQESYPSWLYPVKNGATTIWERLNSYTHEAGFGGNNSMNSFNHYSFGAVAAWMVNHSLGIQRDPEQSGFQHFLLVPTPDPTGEMTYARGHYDSPYGRIESEWRVEGAGSTSYRFAVPPNTTATLLLPAGVGARITAPGLREGGRRDDRAVFTLTSGTYTFTVQ